MKMTRVTIGIAVSIVVLFVLISGFRSIIFSTVERVTMPVVKLFSPIIEQATKQWDDRREASQLRDHISDLEHQLSALSVDYVKLRSLEEENVSLRKESGFLKDSGYDSVGARVISRTIDPVRSQILIDRGTNDALEVGMAVVSDGGVLVGSITSVRKETSVVTLLDDVMSHISAMTSQGRTLVGVVEGSGNNVAKLQYIPQQTAMKSGDMIVSSGQEEKIPANLPYGIVTRVDAVPTDPFKTATVECIISARSIRLVNVLRASVLRPVTK